MGQGLLVLHLLMTVTAITVTANHHLLDVAASCVEVTVAFCLALGLEVFLVRVTKAPISLARYRGPSTRLTRCVPASANQRSPEELPAIADGVLVSAPAAGPLSPVDPAVPAVPATWTTLAPDTIRTQLRPPSAMTTRPLESTATPAGADSETVPTATVPQVVVAPPPATWLTVAPVTLRTQLRPVSAMNTLPELSTATPPGAERNTAVAVAERDAVLAPRPRPG